jgi:hypothetical protein
MLVFYFAILGAEQVTGNRLKRSSIHIHYPYGSLPVFEWSWLLFA